MSLLLFGKVICLEKYLPVRLNFLNTRRVDIYLYKYLRRHVLPVGWPQKIQLQQRKRVPVTQPRSKPILWNITKSAD